ncbi:MAG TPA: helix-turn-helix domain-containing protein [Methylophilaceae bacterium]|nr:helix-turn-helix domain-containing protein [Methylophilaceae bacterium]
MEINKLLDDCKEKLGIESDYRLARIVDISDQRLSDYRRGKRIPDAYACSKIAEVLEVDEMKLIAHFEAMSAKIPKIREYWEKKLERLGGIAAAIFVVVNLIMTPTPSQAAPMLKQDGSAMYIMLNSIYADNQKLWALSSVDETGVVPTAR